MELPDIKAVRKHMPFLAVDEEHQHEQWKIEAIGENGKIAAAMDFGITEKGKLTKPSCA